MKNHIFKLLIIFLVSLLSGLSEMRSQVLYKEGVELENDKSIKMTRMMNGDDNSFYCYRVQARSGFDSYYIQKFNKSDFAMVFSKEIDFPTSTAGSRINDVQFASGHVFVFAQQYNKDSQRMTLFFRVVSPSGSLSEEKEIISFLCDHYEFVNFEIIQNKNRTKFLIKSVHKQFAEDAFKTEFIVIDATKQVKTGLRHISQDLRSSGKQFAAYYTGFRDVNFGVFGLYLDDNGKIYYCITEPVDEPNRSLECKLSLCCLDTSETTPKRIVLPLGSNVHARDMKILKAANNSIEVAGFFHETLLNDKKLVNCGFFSFRIDEKSDVIASKIISRFEEATLIDLQSIKKKAEGLNYKLDKVVSKNNSMYYIGQQYKEKPAGPLYWDYEYRDIIIVKFTNSQLQWIRRIPLFSELRVNYHHTFMQYIIYDTNKNLHILLNDNPENMEYYDNPDSKAKNIRPMEAIHGSAFVCNSINLQDGKIRRTTLFMNRTFCFAPIRERRPKFVLSSEENLYIPITGNSIYLHTENRGRDKFDQLTFE